jgi:carboxypeptidase D
METTVEVSCCKFPDASSSELEEFWRLNKKSLIEYLKSANTGVRGIVSFKDGTVAKHVTVKIGNREPFFKTNKNGEFFRVLLPGRYNLTVAFNCDSVYQTNIEISASSRLLEFNVTLNECLMNQYKRANMTRYAVFCGNSSSYIPCVDSHQSKIDIIVNFFKAIWSFLANLIPIG